MLQHTTQQATRIRKAKSVVTKEFLVVTEIAKDLKKFYCERVKRLKRKMFVRTRKIMLQHTSEVELHDKLVANRFGVTTQYILVAATRTRLLHQNYVTHYQSLTRQNP